MVIIVAWMMLYEDNSWDWAWEWGLLQCVYTVWGTLVAICK